jgi:3',5'-cyclic AMP phosphodiesterase CpdA
MTRIVHLSDPHFGTEPECLPARLIAHLVELAPDLIVLSGDLTQRALPHQFRAARRFIADLPAPTLVIPGNHDAPLWNLPLRLIDPWRTWRTQLGRPLDGRVENESVIIVGLNSAYPWVWKDGRIGATQREALGRALDDAGLRRRIVSLHHPPVPPEGEPPSLVGAAELMALCEGLGVEMILSGHLHFTQVAPISASILGVQTGTCLSSRIRGEGNAFTVLDLRPSGVAVSHHRLAADGRFVPDAVTEWTRDATGWR